MFSPLPPRHCRFHCRCLAIISPLMPCHADAAAPYFADAMIFAYAAIFSMAMPYAMMPRRR